MGKIAAEMARIQQQCPFLTSNSCTPNFCQSGRMIHSNEPRIGENRSLLSVVKDALDFLHQLRQVQIRANSVWTNGADNENSKPPSNISREGFAVGFWEQTTEELEYGLRCAWKHARKWIMRSEHQNLR